MNIFSSSVKRPTSVAVIILAIIAIAFVFVSRLNIEAFPQIDIPVISVTTTYKGAGPEEVEDQITIPIEEAVGSISNIEEIESSSSQNLSIVVVRFHYGTNMNTAAADVREKLDRAKKDLPEEAEDPVIGKADPADRPVVQLAMTSKTGDMRRLRSLADNEVKKELEKIGGVSSVKVSGGMERAILVKVDRDKLSALSIPVNKVVSAVAKENANTPLGRITASNLEFGVRSMGELKSPEDFKDILVGMVNGKSIFLKDVAVIKDSHKEVRKISRYNGKQSVTIVVKKNRDANIVVIAEDVKKIVKKINKNLPEGFILKVAYDQSTFIKKAIRNLEETGIQGAILAIIIILIFLGSVRSTLVIGLSIPFSVIATFLLMYFNNLTINMMTLVGFILAIGNIVDASIVVLENIYRHLEMGKEPVTAAIEGAQEVGGAVFGAASTTIIVFVPMFLITGLAGQIFTPLAKTFCFAIFCSFIAAVSVVPMMSSLFLKAEVKSDENRKGFWNLFRRGWDKFFGLLLSIYKGVLKWCISHRAIVVIVAIVLFVISLVMGSRIKTALQGKWDRGDFNVSVETPVGSSLSRTEKVVDDVQKYILREFSQENNSTVTNIGQGPSGSQGAGSTFSVESPRLGGFTVSLVDAEERTRSVYEVQDIVTAKFKNYPGAKIKVEELFSISGKKPVEILIRGNNLDKLSELATNIMNKLEKVEGLKNIDLNFRPGAPEYKIRIDRKKVADLGMGSAEIARILRILLSEDRVSTFREEGNEYDIFVQLPEKQRNSIDKLGSLKIVTPAGKQVPLKEIAKITPSFGPSSITRRDRSRYVSVQADISGDRALSQVIGDVIPIIKEEKFPTGYNWILAGEEQKRQEIFGEMFQVLFLAIIFVYVFLAVQFESFIHPFTIMVAVPLELIGVFGALYITGQTMTMFALLGIIMLVGIVVSNAIVLLDYILSRKRAGMSTREAIMEAAPLRLRPIMMTAFTTIFAMIPLAAFPRPGSEMFQPLATGVIGGLFASTALTLLVIPVVYSIFEDISEKISQKK
ncbi:MAG: efflux RND transporter permease subunit [Candidatus Eremiobacteraeota bacterium]|nr:efflux RND transporter permease subunit [Candidatus Eremiobacteraeota bacterium]